MPEVGKKSRRKPAIQARRFGFITSNSLGQVLCRRVVSAEMEGKAPLHLVFAIPDHPRTGGAGSADARIAVTVAEAGVGGGFLSIMQSEVWAADGIPDVTLATKNGSINADLTIGADAKAALPLHASERLCSRV